MEELAHHLKEVLDVLKYGLLCTQIAYLTLAKTSMNLRSCHDLSRIEQAIVFGMGAGANIALRLAV